MQAFRTLTTILYDANPLQLQKVQGNADCIMMVVSRDYCATPSLKEIPEMQEPCIYVLANEGDKVYIGQSRSFSDRVKDHLTKKDWWTKAFVFVSDAGRYDSASVEYLEYLAIKEVQEVNRYDWSENKQLPKNPTLRSYERPKMNEVFQEIKFFLLYVRCYLFLKDEKDEASVSATTPSSQEEEKPYIPQSPIEEYAFKDEPFFLTARGCKAQGRAISKKQFLILKGSRIAPHTTPSFSCYAQREKILAFCNKKKGEQGEYYFLNENYLCTSPSTAATICAGHSLNGKIEWKDAKGNPLKSYLEE